MGRISQIPPGQRIAGYDLDANRVILPMYVQQMSPKKRRRWMKEHHLIPAIGGGAGYGSTFLQMMEPFQVADGTTLSTSVTETVISSDSLLTLPANVFANPGKTFWCRFMGKVSNIVTTPGTVTFRIRFGGSGITGTQLAATGAVNFRTTASTDNLWYVEIIMKALATGPATNSLSILTYGESFIANSAYAVADIASASLPPAGTSLATVASMDGTIAQKLSLTAQFSVSNAGNAITVRDAWIVAMN